VSSIVNQPRYTVKAKCRPDLTREFPHTKAKGVAWHPRWLSNVCRPFRVEAPSRDELPHGVAVIARAESQPDVEPMRLLELLRVELDP
jgi:hypothetical protein